MTEYNPIEVKRLRSLASGIAFDMGAHVFGVLSLFCDLNTEVGMKVGFAGKHTFSDEYGGREYFAETAVELRFKLMLRHQNLPVDVYARVGKALKNDAKYIEFCGDDDRIARIDFSSKPGFDPETGYPHGGIFTGFSRSGQKPGTGEIVDPYDAQRILKFDGEIPPAIADRPAWYRHGRLVNSFYNNNYEDWHFLLDTQTALVIMEKLEAVRRMVVNLPPYVQAREEWWTPSGWQGAMGHFNQYPKPAALSLLDYFPSELPVAIEAKDSARPGTLMDPIDVALSRLHRRKAAGRAGDPRRRYHPG